MCCEAAFTRRPTTASCSCRNVAPIVVAHDAAEADPAERVSFVCEYGTDASGSTTPRPHAGAQQRQCRALFVMASFRDFVRKRRGAPEPPVPKKPQVLLVTTANLFVWDGSNRTVDMTKRPTGGLTLTHALTRHVHGLGGSHRRGGLCARRLRRRREALGGHSH